MGGPLSGRGARAPRVTSWARGALFAAALLGAASSGAQTTATNAVSSTTINARRSLRVRLSNGLDVLLEEDHRSPRVAVHVEYRVGARDQPAGYTGLAHTVEHVMFSWCRWEPRGFHVAIEQLGGSGVNAITSADTTEYFESAPASQLERVLALEADRMGFLLAHLDEPMLAAQRRVVGREFAQHQSSVDVVGLGAYVDEALFPVGHPYRKIREREDELRALTLDNVRWFHQRWYVPSNAMLVVVGDFELSRARAMVERHFGGLATVNPPRRRGTNFGVDSVGLGREGRIVAVTPSPQSSVAIVWRTPAYLAPDDAEFDVIAYVLAQGALGRLDQRLVRELGVAQVVSARQQSMQLESLFTIDALVSEGRTTGQVLEPIDRELARLRREPVSQEEIDAFRAAFALGDRQAESSMTTRAELLSLYARSTEGFPDPTAIERERYQRVTPQSVLRAAQRYLVPERRVVAEVRGGRSAPAHGQVVYAPTLESGTAVPR
jgi:zinc protease